MAGFALILSACAQSEDRETEEDFGDPIIQQALNDRLMVDPDLAFQNEGNAALTIGFDHSLPPIDTSPDTLLQIRDDARVRLLDGGAVLELPEASQSDDVEPLAGVFNARERALKVPASRQCLDGLEYSAIWAARLPSFAEILPRGAVVEAAGTGLKRCKLRVVSYRTPLSVKEALQFHWTNLVRAELKPRYLELAGGEYALQGAKRSAAVAINAWPFSDKLTSVEIISLERE